MLLISQAGQCISCSRKVGRDNQLVRGRDQFSLETVLLPRVLTNVITGAAQGQHSVLFISQAGCTFYSHRRQLGTVNSLVVVTSVQSGSSGPAQCAVHFSSWAVHFMLTGGTVGRDTQLVSGRASVQSGNNVPAQCVNKRNFWRLSDRREQIRQKLIFLWHIANQ